MTALALIPGFRKKPKRTAGGALYRGRFTWRALTYERCRREDLLETDLVVMMRPRFPEVPPLLDACAASRLRTSRRRDCPIRRRSHSAFSPTPTG